jgi:hypothetical protein
MASRGRSDAVPRQVAAVADILLAVAVTWYHTFRKTNE